MNVFRKRILRFTLPILAFSLLLLVVIYIRNQRQIPPAYLGHWCADFKNMPTNTTWEFAGNGSLIVWSKDSFGVDPRSNNLPIRRIKGTWTIKDANSIMIQIPYLHEFTIQKNGQNLQVIFEQQSSYSFVNCTEILDSAYSHKLRFVVGNSVLNIIE